MVWPSHLPAHGSGGRSVVERSPSPVAPNRRFLFDKDNSIPLDPPRAVRTTLKARVEYGTRTTQAQPRPGDVFVCTSRQHPRAGGAYTQLPGPLRDDIRSCRVGRIDPPNAAQAVC